ncbi:MAG: hypothetical protein EXR11_04535 [Rhodospirillaceae bacterium]|nr:hypothetical protein [Rhodospirillaceae bacterium]
MSTKKFDKDRRGDIDIYLGEPNEQVRESMRAMLRGEGFRAPAPSRAWKTSSARLLRIPLTC